MARNKGDWWEILFQLLPLLLILRLFFFLQKILFSESEVEEKKYVNEYVNNTEELESKFEDIKSRSDNDE